MKNIALVVSHPIQHFCPQYSSFAKNTNVRFKVFFASAIGHKRYLDKNFGKEISWGNLYLDEFDHVFLNGDQVLSSDKDLDAKSLEKELSAYQPDLVIVYGYFQKLQRRAYHWAVKNSIPLAYISDSELRHLRNRIGALLKYLPIRIYFSRIKYFLSVGNANEEFYKQYGVKQDQLMRMHFPINVNQFGNAFLRRDSLRNEIRAQYGIEGEEPVMLTVGKLVSWKNQDHIIGAMKLLEDIGIYTHLFIVGSGIMLEYWKEKAGVLKKSKVHFAGFIAPEALPLYYAAADIYVHAASVEPHSIAVSEAIYMGCPVILSDRCGSFGPDDDVQSRKNGLVYKFGDIDDLAKKIRALTGDDLMRTSFSDYSIKASRMFQQQSHFGIIEDLVKRLN